MPKEQVTLWIEETLLGKAGAHAEKQGIALEDSVYSFLLATAKTEDTKRKDNQHRS